MSYPPKSRKLVRFELLYYYSFYWHVLLTHKVIGMHLSIEYFKL